MRNSALFSLYSPELIGMGTLSSVKLDFYVNHVNSPGLVSLAWFASNLTSVAFRESITTGTSYSGPQDQGAFMVGIGPTISIRTPGRYSLQAYPMQNTLLTGSFQSIFLGIEPGGLLSLTSIGLEGVPTVQSQNMSLTILSLGSSDPPQATLVLVQNIYPAGLENYWPWLSYAFVAVVSLFFRDDKLTETLFLTVLSISAAWEMWILGTYLFGPSLANALSVAVAATLILANWEQQYQVFRIAVRKARGIR